MKKIILDLAVTLDGYIEGPNGEIDWCIVEPDANSGEFLGDLLPDIDTIFYGRISYDLWGNYQPDPNASPAIAKAYRSIHTKTKYVFTTQPRADEDQVIFIQGDIEKKVNQIKQQPGKNIWLYGGGKLITTFVNHNLVDVYRLAVHPVILGAGKPLFENIRHRTALKLNSAKSGASGVVMLNYERK